MAASFHSRGAVALLALAAAGAAAQPPVAPEGIDLEAETFEYDGGTSRVNFRGLRLSQGDLRIAADRAVSNSLESDTSEWELEGNVRITIDTATVESDSAHFTMRGNVLSVLDLEGRPATFEDRSPARADVAAGGASRIRYDDSEGTLSLLDDAWLRVGANEITGCDLIFNVDEGTYRSGSAECDQPFRIRILRPSEEAPADDPPPESP